MKFMTKVERNLSIVRYSSSVASSNTQIKLEQNLFSFLLKGSKSVQYAGSRVTISPNQFFLLSAGNCLMSEKIAAPDAEYQSMLFFFDNELLTDFFTRHPMPTRSGRGKRVDEPFLVFEKDAFLTNFIDSLGLILSSGQSLSLELQRVKLEELLIYISGCYPEVMERLHGYSYNSDQDLLIRQAVTANSYNVITVEELAFVCNMTLSTFKRHFAKLYGTSPNKWLLEKRMQKAAQMLRESDCNASEIFVELGYENLSSFVQSFKQVHGTTPKQYQLKV